MRSLCIALTLLAAPATAWEFSAEPTCTVTDNTVPTALEMTFDGSVYTLTLTHPEGWPPGAIFGISFAPNGPLIETDRHVIDGQDLTVSDSGFGNVLRGLEGNVIATALISDVSRELDLTGAAPVIAQFRACWPAVPST